jgi:DNA helicase-2/ATP-dependent DNA helicase PcrA
LREGKNPSVSKTLNLVLRQSGYLQMLAMEGTAESEDRIGNLEELESVARDFEQTADDPSLLTFLEQVALTADVDSLDQSSSGQVKLLTLHSSKGLEFPLVFIAGMEEGIFPHSRSFDNKTELEEERRLCYVGMTRAMRQLVLAFSRSRSSAGPAMPSMPSRFLSDIPEEFVDRKPSSDIMVGYSSWSSRVRPEMFSGSSSVAHSESAERKRELWNPPFNVGDRVSHSKFGTGVVIACAPLKQDAEVTVAFPGETGVKKLVQSFAKLVKEG